MFKQFLDINHIRATKIAVGVSGGSDSLALALMAAEELHPLGYTVIALTVDHQLRPTSAQEAEYVGKIMQENHIEHHVLIWHGTKPQTGIEEAAREARYNLIAGWCQQNGVENVMMAHHLQDQAETFFLRLQRGSGLDGLCGMKELSKRKGINILRPLLTTDKNTLIQYLVNRKIQWVEDESNGCDDLLRVKIRQFLPLLFTYTGINSQTIADTMIRLQSSRDYIDSEIDKILSENFTIWDNCGFSCPHNVWLSFCHEVQFRLLSRLVQNLGALSYAPRAKSLCRIIKHLENTSFKSATLGQCQILCQYNMLWIVPQYPDMKSYNRKNWEKYVENHPDLRRIKLPYRLKAALLHFRSR